MKDRFGWFGDSPAHWLRDNMQKYGHTQRELAHLLDLDPSAVSRLLSNQRRLKPREYSLLSSLFAPGVLQKGSEDAASLLRSIDEFRANAAGARTTGERSGQLGANAKLTDAISGAVPDLHTHSDVGRHRTEVASTSGPDRLMPIYAPPRLTERGLWLDYAIAEWRLSPFLSSTGEFGVFVGKDRVGERFRVGDVLLIHPSRPVREGDETMVRLDNNRVQFGTLAAYGENRIMLRSSEGEQALDLSSLQAQTQKIVGVWFE